MNARRLAALAAIIAWIVSFGAGLTAQELTPEQQKAMETYTKLMATNENHSFLAGFAGEWTVTTTSWMQPGAPPVTNAGTAKIEIVLGGRYLMMRFAGQMFGQLYEGLQIVGYDNQQRKYVSLWIDSMGTAFYLTTGTREPNSNTINDTGVWPDPMGGTSKVRAVTKLVSPDEYTYELYMVNPDGSEFKSFEYRATRKK